MSSSSPSSCSWKSFLKTLLFLAPPTAAWIFSSQFLLPKIQETWMGEWPWPGGDSPFDVSKRWIGHYWTAIGLLIGIVLVLHLLLGSKPKARRIAVGTSYWLANLGVLFGMLYMIVATLMAYTSARNDLAGDVFGSVKNMAEMAASSKVVVTRLHLKNEKDDQWEIANYSRDAEITLTSQQALVLKTALLDKSSYYWHISRMCGVNYGVSYVFSDVTPPLEVAICFDCAQFAVFENGKDVSRESLLRLGPFVRLTKQLYSEDAEIQAIGTFSK